MAGVRKPIAIVSTFLCTAVLFGWDGNLAEAGVDAGEDGPKPAHGVVAQNKGPTGEGCSSAARYSIEFGRDGDPNLIDFSSFTLTTIETMRSWPAPSIIPPANRISPYETTVLILDATLVEYLRERDSEFPDYRLVLADVSGNTILATIASPDCAAQQGGEPGSQLPQSRFLAGIENARAESDDRLAPTTTVQHANIHVRIMGIGMFEHPTGQSGAAPNGIELSPVLDMSFDQERMPVISVPVQHHVRTAR